MERTLLSDLAEKWSSTWVTRCEAKKFSGGLIGEKYLANLDSQGKGPAGRIRCGRKIAYPVAEFVKFLEARSEAIPKRNK
ncbi:hypothetical protein DS62_10870 [Smithella sp. SC_K08D17]|jgi:hypothetical protein|nr:hypothetical protein KD27_05305 [Smithella sp. D17]KIE18414.1 hypothetical protein DS62_10870 [Smithella sp. SC_K08D17]